MDNWDCGAHANKGYPMFYPQMGQMTEKFVSNRPCIPPTELYETAYSVSQQLWIITGFIGLYFFRIRSHGS